MIKWLAVPAVALALSLASTAAFAAPCAGFTDVDDTSPFCGNVTWLKNRGITLGCTSTTLFCPGDFVSRLQMAAFMNRLGDSLFPLTCAAGQVMKWDGLQWACANDAIGGGGGGGTVTSVAAGTGLQGSPNPITGAGAINIAPGYQLPQACANGQVPKSNGAGGWACGTDTAGTGTVTSVTAGTGLTGGTITASGTVAADTSYLQRRVSSTCAVGSSIRIIAADGTVTCQTGTPGPAGPPGPANRISNQQIALLQWFQDPGRAAVVPVGSYPYSVVFDGSNVWVSNGSSDTVSRINPVTNAVIATIPVGSVPDGLAYDGTNIWVANSNSNTVSRINRATNAVTPVTVAGSPTAVAFDGTNIWAANFNTNTVSKINPVAATVIYSVAVGLYPNAIAFDGTSIWVVNLASNALSRIDPNAANPASAVIGTIPLPPGGAPNRIAYDGTYLWVTSGGVNQALKVDPNASPASAVVGTVSVGNYPTGVAYDGTSVWVAGSNANTVSRINPTTNTASTFTISNPVGIAYDGTNLWVVNSNGGGTVSKIIPF